MRIFILMFRIHRKLFLALKKVEMVKITSPGSHYPVKKFPLPSKISDSHSLRGFREIFPHPLLLFGKSRGRQEIAINLRIYGFFLE